MTKEITVTNESGPEFHPIVHHDTIAEQDGSTDVPLIQYAGEPETEAVSKPAKIQEAVDNFSKPPSVSQRQREAAQDPPPTKSNLKRRLLGAGAVVGTVGLLAATVPHGSSPSKEQVGAYKQGQDERAGQISTSLRQKNDD